MCGDALRPKLQAARDLACVGDLACGHTTLTMHARIAAFVQKANATFEAKGYPLKLANWFSVWSMMPTMKKTN